MAFKPFQGCVSKRMKIMIAFVERGQCQNERHDDGSCVCENGKVHDKTGNRCVIPACPAGQKRVDDGTAAGKCVVETELPQQEEPNAGGDTGDLFLEDGGILVNDLADQKKLGKIDGCIENLRTKYLIDGDQAKLNLREECEGSRTVADSCCKDVSVCSIPVGLFGLGGSLTPAIIGIVHANNLRKERKNETLPEKKKELCIDAAQSMSLGLLGSGVAATFLTGLSEKACTGAIGACENLCSSKINNFKNDFADCFGPYILGRRAPAASSSSDSDSYTRPTYSKKDFQKIIAAMDCGDGMTRMSSIEAAEAHDKNCSEKGNCAVKSKEKCQKYTNPIGAKVLTYMHLFASAYENTDVEDAREHSLEMARIDGDKDQPKILNCYNTKNRDVRKGKSTQGRGVAGDLIGLAANPAIQQIFMRGCEAISEFPDPQIAGGTKLQERRQVTQSSGGDDTIPSDFTFAAPGSDSDDEDSLNPDKDNSGLGNPESPSLKTASFDNNSGGDGSGSVGGVGGGGSGGGGSGGKKKKDKKKDRRKKDRVGRVKQPDLFPGFRGGGGGFAGGGYRSSAGAGGRGFFGGRPPTGKKLAGLGGYPGGRRGFGMGGRRPSGGSIFERVSQRIQNFCRDGLCIEEQ